ncbi:hypothetical protein N7540_003638 [Penicillium herquei]|nr:hypothetical protein N7540_003638 [Penicillium herquei]
MAPLSRAPRFHLPMRHHRQDRDDHSQAEASTPTGNPAVNARLPPGFEGPRLPDEQRPHRPWTYHLNRALEDSLVEPITTRADVGEVADDAGTFADAQIDTTIVENCPLCGAEDREVPIFTTNLPSVQDAAEHIAQANQNVPHSVTIMECVSTLFALQAEFTELRRRYHSELHENRALLLQVRSLVGPNRVRTLNTHMNHFIPLRRYLIMNEFERMARRLTATRAGEMEARQRMYQARRSHNETVPETESPGADDEIDEILRRPRAAPGPSNRQANYGGPPTSP